MGAFMATNTDTPPEKRSRVRPVYVIAAVAASCGMLGVALKMLEPSPPPPAPKLLTLPVAIGPLQPGRVIESSDFFTKSFSPAERANLPELLYSNGKQILGRIVKNPVQQGQPFALDSLYPEGTGPSPVSALPAGFRGVTVDVELVGGVRGFAAPDAWVDVMFRRDSRNVPTSAEEAKTHTLFRSVQVLAVEDLVYPNSQLPASGRRKDDFQITLALTPDQAEVIKSLEGRGTLSLSLLPPSEEHEALGDIPSPHILDLLLGVVEPEPEPQPVPEPTPDRVQLYRGGQGNMVEFHAQNSLAPSVPAGRFHHYQEFYHPGPVYPQHIAPPHQPMPRYQVPVAPQQYRQYPMMPEPEPAPALPPIPQEPQTNQWPGPSNSSGMQSASRHGDTSGFVFRRQEASYDANPRYNHTIGSSHGNQDRRSVLVSLEHPGQTSTVSSYDRMRLETLSHRIDAPGREQSYGLGFVRPTAVASATTFGGRSNPDGYNGYGSNLAAPPSNHFHRRRTWYNH